MGRGRKVKLHDAKDVIKALGGPSAVARWLVLDQSTVSGWGCRSEIGRGWRMHVYWTLRANGFEEKDIPPRAFGVRSWRELIMPKCRVRKVADRAKRPVRGGRPVETMTA